MKTYVMKIEGMSCGHCVMAVRKELSKIDNVKINDVQIGSAKVEYDDNKIDTQILIKAVQEAGYKVIN